VGLGGLAGAVGGVGVLGGVLGGVPWQWNRTELSVGGRLLLGWTFRFDNRLTVQLAAGPSGSVSRTRHVLTSDVVVNDASSPSIAGGFGLTAFAALGVAL
jgi:hypothetical protein